jgi:hypothetical protein
MLTTLDEYDLPHLRTDDSVAAQPSDSGSCSDAIVFSIKKGYPSFIS